MCSVTLSNRREQLAQPRLEPAVDLDHVHVRDARRASRSESIPWPPPISSTTSSAAELGEPLDHVEDVAVDEEVLAELDHPNTAAALRSIARSSSS